MSSFLDAQLGFAAESTYGTRVTPTLFLPFLSEGVKFEQDYMQSKSYRTGRQFPQLQRPGLKRARGPVKLEFAPQGLNLITKHMLGALATTGAGPYVHTATPGSMVGQSLTMQICKTDRSGTQRPFDYKGVKITDWTIEAQVGEIATLELGTYGQTEDTSQSIATATYPSGWLPFTFVEGSVTLGGTATPIKHLTLKGDNGYGLDVGQLGSALVREPVTQDIRQITGTFDADFADLTAYNRYVNQTQVALVATFAQAGGHQCVITASIETIGETPNAGGAGEEIRQPLSFLGVHPTSDASVITIATTNSDATP